MQTTVLSVLGVILLVLALHVFVKRWLVWHCPWLMRRMVAAQTRAFKKRLKAAQSAAFRFDESTW